MTVVLYLVAQRATKSLKKDLHAGGHLMSGGHDRPNPQRLHRYVVQFHRYKFTRIKVFTDVPVGKHRNAQPLQRSGAGGFNTAGNQSSSHPLSHQLPITQHGPAIYRAERDALMVIKVRTDPRLAAST